MYSFSDSNGLQREHAEMQMCVCPVVMQYCKSENVTPTFNNSQCDIEHILFCEIPLITVPQFHSRMKSISITRLTLVTGVAC